MDEEGIKLLREWFIKRFRKTPEQDKSYFNEWVERFDTGSPYRYMDFESRRAYLDVLKERMDAYGGTGKRKRLKKVV
jgi:hypothetical protein